MNAPANITTETGWRRYLPIVDTFCSAADIEERKMRCRVMAIRDQAAHARTKAENWAAQSALATVEQLGLANSTTAMPIERLKAIGEAMAEMFALAVKLEVAGPA